MSALIVGVFAVLLHDKNDLPPPSRPPARDVAGAKLGHVEAGPTGPRPDRATNPRAIPVPREPSKAEQEVAAVPSPPPRPPEARPVGPSPKPSTAPSAPSIAADRPRSAPRRPAPARPRGGFTIVEAGETLADVAARVYGSSDSAEALWKANRDQLERVDSALGRGTLLRTP